MLSWQSEYGQVLQRIGNLGLVASNFTSGFGGLLSGHCHSGTLERFRRVVECLLHLIAQFLHSSVSLFHHFFYRLCEMLPAKHFVFIGTREVFDEFVLLWFPLRPENPCHVAIEHFSPVNAITSGE